MGGQLTSIYFLAEHTKTAVLHVFLDANSSYTIRQLEQDSSPKGIAIMRALEAEYDRQLNHSRLYQNLDDLVDLALIEKGKKDDSTNEYSTSPEGRQLLKHEAARRVETVGLETGTLCNRG